MKLMNLNTHSWIEENPELKLEQLAAYIAQQDYDVITLQEVNQLMIADDWKMDDYFCPVSHQRVVKEDNFAKVLVEQLRARGLVYYWAWQYAHIGYDRYDEGVAILSKTPIHASAHLVSTSQEDTDFHTRVLLVGETTIDGHRVCVASGHFSWWDDFSVEWKHTVEILQEKRPLPLIVMGDFNNSAHVRGEGYDLVAKNTLSLRDVWTIAKHHVGEWTVEKAIDGWEGNVQQLRIDLAWVTPEVEVEEYRVICDGKNGPIVSDHFGIAVHAQMIQ